APERPVPVPERAAPPSPANANPNGALQAPPNRAEMLARLRDRAGKLPPERVAEILASRTQR
ncbi:MAG TPA: hypothetical protein VLT33_42075, partial [Labilithrix sp.]|nr:hypothetical protein [Labilithrix sp.]